jgi:hypothetical protein
MSLTKLSLAGNNLINPGQGDFGYSDIPAVDRKNSNLFYSACTYFLNVLTKNGLKVGKPFMGIYYPCDASPR